MTSTDPSSLVIAVLTFRRPADLEAILPLLDAQADAASDLVAARRVLVVDNDPDASARDAVEAAAGRSRAEIRYVHEPVPGIAAARNRALDESTDADLLAFIDDDERPTDSWLRSLLITFRHHEPVAVVGPVVSRFDIQPDTFIVAGRFFERRRMPTGTDVVVAATNNLLLDLRRIRGWGLRFDIGSGISGGEDTLFTRSIHACGGRMVWCDEAVVHDVVPATRTTRRWVLLRALSSGNSWGLTSVQLAGGAGRRFGVRLRLHAHGVTRITGGAARTVAGVLLSNEPKRAGGLRTAARGVGMLLGAWNIRYREYRRP